ncbi:PTS sugar transporter subunit IIB [Brachyspira hyodysenteriae]|uniref:Phosphotransferase enzyme II, B compnent SgaB n=2 Tax=Brachyspira hyodysenteriae TaxID=159 RepID=A0A3B6V923_BRAHW|nr:PTS sugar transporter subunit IIB [Brachyspira hyodysenteriae]ACN83099.1 phosphotransferase enzyme II, B compnent SgaB [Brachyspira hyodysenteriae WA1]ANN64781.1 PTS ascorbate transporter subunit IIB [Brachyspira hyodysenteriae ATCC 27164]AUJ48843.1 PTS ascorbate transporter subunit IIB [Brachyspira hyodysenteriae]KLI13726.1 PTS ascorbate transporter subunit IIB [Brachyspira hyodysenteriae]KLI14890.1 PTS ascorbate transporter subunit IIB [Brachyspira hyodysenteriae]
MLKVLVVCANGTGTSLMMKEKAQMALIKLGVENLSIDHCDMNHCKTGDYDLIFCPNNFLDSFKEAEQKGAKLIGIKNILSEEEFKQKLESSGYLDELKHK